MLAQPFVGHSRAVVIDCVRFHRLYDCVVSVPFFVVSFKIVREMCSGIYEKRLNFNISIDSRNYINTPKMPTIYVPGQL